MLTKLSNDSHIFHALLILYCILYSEEKREKTLTFHFFFFFSFASQSIQNAEYLFKHSGGQYSALDMAQYVFWTGDEEGVAKAVEEFIRKGLVDIIQSLTEMMMLLFFC